MKILLIEDHKMVATSLKMSLETDESISVDIVNNVRELRINESILNYDLLLIVIGVRSSIPYLSYELVVLIIASHKSNFRVACPLLVEFHPSLLLKNQRLSRQQAHLLNKPSQQQDVHQV